VGLEESEAALPALGEGLERYCALVYTKEQFIRASAEELGREALNLDTIPRCSAKALSLPGCPLTAPSKRAPIRWVRALSLLDGRLCYVPAVMVYLYAKYESPHERICFPITTGCAAHTSFERALLSGILEVIERDAISITWLQKLQLSRIEVDCIPPSLTAYWDRYQRSSREVEYSFFDATTNIGIPTVYALQTAKANQTLTTLVSCSTALDPARAMAKAMSHSVAAMLAFCNPWPIPDKWEDFTEITHGASYMGRPEQAHAFNFLFRSGERRRLSKMPCLASEDEKHALQTVLAILRRERMDVYAVDLSTDEAIRARLRVVRVIIPGLQPVGFQYRARYLGHARLYEAPAQMGHPVHGEEHLNHWPQPFS
jgi:ribosomal protein S12 methylthiotransferase accessory factor